MTDGDGPDWGALYRDHLDALEALLSDLDADALASPVPATPGWNVHDVVAHLAGGPADSVADRTDGAPGPEWTARHVSERAGVPVADLVAEMRGNVDWVAHWCTTATDPGIVWDVATHHADLHEALGKHQLADHFWRPVLDQLGPRVAPDLLESDVAAYEVFRAIFSRRSMDQMAAWGTGLPEERLAEIGVFGPRGDDQPVPGSAAQSPAGR